MTPARRDALILATIVVLAAVLRFINLPSRGPWDDDQGYELLTMLLWVRDGQVPLLGPVSSVHARASPRSGFLLAPRAQCVSDGRESSCGTDTLAVLGVGGVAVPPLAALHIADLARRSRCDRHRNDRAGDRHRHPRRRIRADADSSTAQRPSRTGRCNDREPGTATQFGRWAVATIIWATGALTFLAPSLAEFTPGLPNDQYHGWLTPAVFAVTGVAKSGAAMAFPLWRDGKPNTPPGAILVVTCDRLFEHSVGMLCGGTAESAIARQAGFSRPVGRFEDGPRRVVWVFART